MTLDEQLQALANGQDANAANPLVVDLGGEKLTFNSAEELSANLRQALAEVNQNVSKLRMEKEQLESQLQSAPKNQYATSDSDVTPGVDMDHFVGLMRKNPVEAFEYIDEIRYGQKNPTNYIKESLSRAEEIRQENEVNKWLQAHPEFPGGQAATVLNGIREQLGQPMTKLGLEAAYNHAIQNQQLPDFRLQQALQYQQAQFAQYLQANGIQLPQAQNQQPQNNFTPQQPIVQQNQPQNQNPYPVMGNQGLPTVPRQQSTQLSNMGEQAAEKLSFEQLESLLKQNGLI